MQIDWESILNNSGVGLVGVDVGCSSGRPHEWARLGSALMYLGIDPLESEINRLISLNEVNSRYLAAFIDFDGATGNADVETSRVFERTSAAQEARAGFDSQKQIYNSGSDVTFSQKKVTVPEIKNLEGFSALDLLKIDIDGGDFNCLKAFNQSGLIDGLTSLTIESQFHGESTNDGNTLWNIGKLANSKGLSLYDLEINRYSRYTLPSKYIYDFPAQTHYGQALWGDSLFINETLNSMPDLHAILKLTAVFEIYSFFDCALELLESHGDSLMEIAPVKEIKKSLRWSHEMREAALEKSSRVLKSHKYSRLKSLVKTITSR